MFVDTDITTNIYGNTSTSGDMWDRIVEVLDPTLDGWPNDCLLYTSPSPRDQRGARMPSSA